MIAVKTIPDVGFLVIGCDGGLVGSPLPETGLSEMAVQREGFDGKAVLREPLRSAEESEYEENREKI